LRSLDEPLVLKYKSVGASKSIVLVPQSMGILLFSSVELLLLTHSFVLSDDLLRVIIKNSIPHFLKPLLNFTTSQCLVHELFSDVGILLQHYPESF
jgi:hypothetical protein